MVLFKHVFHEFQIVPAKLTLEFIIIHFHVAHEIQIWLVVKAFEEILSPRTPG